MNCKILSLVSPIAFAPDRYWSLQTKPTRCRRFTMTLRLHAKRSARKMFKRGAFDPRTSSASACRAKSAVGTPCSRLWRSPRKLWSPHAGDPSAKPGLDTTRSLNAVPHELFVLCLHCALSRNCKIDIVSRQKRKASTRQAPVDQGEEVCKVSTRSHWHRTASRVQVEIAKLSKETRLPTRCQGDPHMRVSPATVSLAISVALLAGCSSSPQGASSLPGSPGVNQQPAGSFGHDASGHMTLMKLLKLQAKGKLPGPVPQKVLKWQYRQIKAHARPAYHISPDWKCVAAWASVTGFRLSCRSKRQPCEDRRRHRRQYLLLRTNHRQGRSGSEHLDRLRFESLWHGRRRCKSLTRPELRLRATYGMLRARIRRAAIFTAATDSTAPKRQPPYSVPRTRTSATAASSDLYR